MREMFETVFVEVMEELGLTDWWELFDSEEFETVFEVRLAERWGVSTLETPEYLEWYDEMAGDL